MIIETPLISPQDLGTIQKTAFYASQYPWFLNAIDTKPLKFIHKEHSLYPYYSSLVEEYKSLLSGACKPTPPARLLEAAERRASEIKEDDESIIKQEQEAEAERMAFSSIDWNDFTVVETVNFTTKDLTADLPEPLTPEFIQRVPMNERANIMDNLKIQTTIISPFDGSKVKSSDYEDHVRAHKNALNRADKQQRHDDESNLYYDDVERNLREWKRKKTS